MSDSLPLPIEPGDPVEIPADSGLVYDNEQPIPLDMLQESLETPSVTIHTAPDVLPPDEDVPLTVVTDSPLTEAGIEKVWTEIPKTTEELPPITETV